MPTYEMEQFNNCTASIGDSTAGSDARCTITHLNKGWYMGQWKYTTTLAYSTTGYGSVGHGVYPIRFYFPAPYSTPTQLHGYIGLYTLVDGQGIDWTGRQAIRTGRLNNQSWLCISFEWINALSYTATANTNWNASVIFLYY